MHKQLLLKIVIICTVCLSCSLAILSQSALGTERLESQCLEQLQMKGDYLLDHFPNLSIAYRNDRDQRYFLLVEPVKENSICGAKSGHVIVAVLPIEKDKKGTWHGVNFTCTNKTGVVKGDTIIGLFEGNGLGPTLKAWKIDPIRKSFQQVDNVVCTSFD